MKLVKFLSYGPWIQENLMLVRNSSTRDEFKYGKGILSLGIKSLFDFLLKICYNIYRKLRGRKNEERY
jgi:hypothetical protein